MKKTQFIHCLHTLVVAALLVVASTLNAQAVARVDIYGPAQNMMHLAMAAPLTLGGKAATDMGGELDRAIKENLEILPFIQLTDPRAVLGGTVLEGAQSAGIDFKRFQLAGADLLVTASWPGGDAQGSTVELRLFETSSGHFMFGKAYKNVTGARLYDVADRFCSDLMEILTGRGEFFLSTLAYVKESGKNQSDVWIGKPTGRDIRKISGIPGTAMSPAWSKDGSFIVFTHIDEKSHSLGVWNRQANQIQRIRYPGNMVIAPAFTPENRVAVSLATVNHPDIYLLNHSFQKDRALEAGSSINIAPTFDDSGNLMAFCSSRLGGPQVFIKDLRTGSVTRVSRQGGYNSEPFISPDGTLVAFSRLTEAGHRIFVYDTVTGFERQVTFGPGSDEQPSFAPDSYFLAFSSTRNGTRQVYLTTRHGGNAKMVKTGNGETSFPRWGMIPSAQN